MSNLTYGEWTELNGQLDPTLYKDVGARPRTRRRRYTRHPLKGAFMTQPHTWSTAMSKYLIIAISLWFCSEATTMTKQEMNNINTLTHGIARRSAESKLRMQIHDAVRNNSSKSRAITWRVDSSRGAPWLFVAALVYFVRLRAAVHRAKSQACCN